MLQTPVRYVPSILLPLAVGLVSSPSLATTHLAPRNCSDGSCQTQTTDGIVNPSEYVDGHAVPLQDWTTSGPNGKMRMVLDGDRLLIGLTFEDTSTSTGDYLVLFLDGHRADTLSGTAPRPMGDDRAIMVQYSDPSRPTITQFAGNGSGGYTTMQWWMQWPTTVKASKVGSDLHIELAITLKPLLLSKSELISSKKFGMSLAVSHPKAHGTYVWPGRPGVDEYGNPNMANGYYTETWETIDVSAPVGVSMGFMTYNTGLLPKIGTFMGPQGNGSPHDFAAIAADPKRDVTCLQEVWGHGDRKEVISIAQSIAELAGRQIYAAGAPKECGVGDSTCTLPFVGTPLEDSGLDRADTGLVLLSQRPILDSKVVEYGNSSTGCFGADCAEDKGVIFARVGTPYGDPKVVKGTTPHGFAADEYVDVYCTHTQASCDDLAEVGRRLDAVYNEFSDLTEFFTGVDLGSLESCSESGVKNVQKRQIAKLSQIIEETRDPRRPAIVMGDLNANAAGSSGAYEQVLEGLNLGQPSYFDNLTSLYSDRYDWALGFFDAQEDHVPVLGQNPVRTWDVLDEKIPSRHISIVGEGTHITAETHHACVDGLMIEPDPHTGRLDHILIVPPESSPQEFPEYAVLKPTSAPVWTNAYIKNVGNPLIDDCYSDHKALSGEIRFERVEDKFRFNPTKTHDVKFLVSYVANRTGDGWGGGGADFFGSLNTVKTGETQTTKSFGVYSADSDIISPGSKWYSTRVLSGVELLKNQFYLKEEDTTNDDKYDITQWLGIDGLTYFSHQDSTWTFRDRSGNDKLVSCMEKFSNTCTVALQSMALFEIIKGNGNDTDANGEHADVGLIIKAEEVQ